MAKITNCVLLECKLTWMPLIFGKLWKKIMKLIHCQTIPPWPKSRATRNRKPGSPKRKTLFVVVSTTIFTRIMSLTSPKEIWDYLKKEYVGDERIRGMQVLNLIREFELQRMKESETIKEYTDRLLGILNKAQEQRRLMMQDGMVEGALQPPKTQSKGKNLKNYPLAKDHGKMGHPPFRCWKRPDAMCNKCNELGHEAVICKNESQNHDADAHVADEEEEDHLFVATCISSKVSTNSWLIDSGCTNHMTYDKSLFKELKPTEISKVWIGNGDQILVEGKGAVVIKTSSGSKTISDVLYVPNIDQNLLSICQLVEKGFKVSFEDKHCFINDVAGKEILKIKMRGKNFSFDPMEDIPVEQAKDHSN
ncbi:uncharacterized protein LOC132061292 [Lycium ferocissimum]|uniref:uncharacterized protein LOC132061292 n=1 Tax=Lycium ferocissimum TaxID=112874 RepID=UPI002816616F|nr:uncharacterized protein LOC132061292 [Lycium ferocissimum]